MSCGCEPLIGMRMLFLVRSDCKGRFEETRSKNTIRLVYGEYSKGLVKISDEWERDLIGQMVTQKKTKM